MCVFWLLINMKYYTKHISDTALLEITTNIVRVYFMIISLGQISSTVINELLNINRNAQNRRFLRTDVAFLRFRTGFANFCNPVVRTVPFYLYNAIVVLYFLCT